MTTVTYSEEEITPELLSELDLRREEHNLEITVHTHQGVYGTVSLLGPDGIEFTTIDDNPRWHDVPETVGIADIHELEVTT